MPLEKNYDSKTTEARLYNLWEKSDAFRADVNSSKNPYTIMIPPPNVTGSLHMGHALSYTLQDILVRYQRMKGRDALWQPGTDHAGIATQMVVERQLAASGKNESRRDMGREAFLKRVWEWKAESGGTITRQLRRLGASCDWSRERFTMDEGLNAAVRKVFVTLYKEGLIYKDKRLVNWDPKMMTAVSDLEVESIEVKGHLWHFKYPIENSDEFVIVATTRPETMLGDAAVAVHPENEKLKHLIGKNVVLPLVGRLIPIIGDEYADPEIGTGAVKITPAHDFNDYEVWKRHRENAAIKRLPRGGLIDVLDKHAQILVHSSSLISLTDDEYVEDFKDYGGLSIFDARKKIVADMESRGLLDKIEPHLHVIPHGDRSGVQIQPRLSDQWYCDAKTLAEPALKAVEDGRTKFMPEQWTNTYYAWMRNIQPWCISRQLWWGHRIPAWYGSDGCTYVYEEEAEAIREAEKASGKKVVVVSGPLAAFAYQNNIDEYAIWQDPDVLDTWFSSALWPFSTLGWPEQTPEVARYYPTDDMVTGFDIIFFWVARMMMMGMHFMKDVPFRTVYIHALVRDEKGQKMSKTKGNVIDPIDVIDKFGCDALRFTLATMSTPGRDIRLATSRIEGNRNFATKLWNAARFCQMNECKWQADFDPASATQTVNKWIIGETKQAVDKIAGLLDTYRFDLASTSCYEFVWNTFCDWYLEFTKPILTGEEGAAKAETRATTAWVLVQILYLLHPFMPFITEELWGEFTGSKEMLILAKWPVLPDGLTNATDINWVKKLIEEIRATRVELNVPVAAKIQLLVKGADKDVVNRITENLSYIVRMARLKDDGIPISYVTETQKNSAQIVFGDITLALPLAGIIDIDKERARLKKESEKFAAEIRKLEAKLGNKDFIDRAPPEVVEEQRERKAEAEATLAKLESAQKSLAG
jgi:valyl-tRNA synthetase